MGFQSTVVIQRPPSEVWAFLTDWSRAPFWMAGIDSMRLVGDGPTARGSRIVFHARGADRESEVIAWEPAHRR